jgi:hypothetical protein
MMRAIESAGHVVSVFPVFPPLPTSGKCGPPGSRWVPHTIPVLDCVGFEITSYIHRDPIDRALTESPKTGSGAASGVRLKRRGIGTDQFSGMAAADYLFPLIRKPANEYGTRQYSNDTHLRANQNTGIYFDLSRQRCPYPTTKVQCFLY